MGQNNPKVTIVTTTYNIIKCGRKDFFVRCLKSVHNQTYKNIEHIIIDGASDDGTVELLKEYDSKGWIKYYSEADNGVYDAMNKSLLYAEGKYINFMNSDDYFYSKNAVEKSISMLESANADYSYGNACVIDNGFYRLWVGNENNLITGMQYNHQTMFLKTDVMKELGGFDLTYKISSDSDLEIRLYKNKYKSVFVDSIISGYQTGGLSGSNVNKVREEHSRSYFIHIGRENGLSEEDCYNLWQYRFVKELPLQEQIILLGKVPEKLGLKELIEEYTRINYKKCKINKIIMYIKLFNLIPLVKITSNSRVKKYYLFSFLPVYIKINKSI